eukprot:GHVS01098719.1.p1 GENE.GHVS01098719.1~~GHVS01098719.1.p1  ORF type:complete len:223 (+),score=35.60 GHVS01098719.1:394-1062(+)
MSSPSPTAILLDSSTEPSRPLFCCFLPPATCFLFCFPLRFGVLTLGVLSLIPLELLLLPSSPLTLPATYAAWALYAAKCLLGLTYLWSAIRGVRCCGVVLCVHQLAMSVCYCGGIVLLILRKRYMEASVFFCFCCICLYFAYLGWSFKWLPQLLPGDQGGVRAESWLFREEARLMLWGDDDNRGLGGQAVSAQVERALEVPLRSLESGVDETKTGATRSRGK